MARVRSLSAVAAFVLVSTGITGAPVATAALAAGSPFCDPSTSAFAGRLVSSDAGDARNGDSREPDLGEVHEDLPATAKGKANKQFKVTVPVYFHVVTDGTIGALTDEPDRRTDRRAQQHLRRRRGRRSDRVHVRTRRRHPYRQRRLVQREARAATPSTR